MFVQPDFIWRVPLSYSSFHFFEVSMNESSIIVGRFDWCWHAERFPGYARDTLVALVDSLNWWTHSRKLKALFLRRKKRSWRVWNAFLTVPFWNAFHFFDCYFSFSLAESTRIVFRNKFLAVNNLLKTSPNSKNFPSRWRTRIDSAPLYERIINEEHLIIDVSEVTVIGLYSIVKDFILNFDIFIETKFSWQ
jgi:hypothetical protein